MNTSESTYLTVRGLRYHLRTWGHPDAPPLYCMHGWMDASASYQFLVDSLTRDWRIVAPDWRGEGLSQWAMAGTYVYEEYVADLDAILEALSPATPVDLVGHSRGGNIVSMYAGIRPERVRRVVNIEGFGLRRRNAEETPDHLAKWLAEQRAPKPQRDYATFEDLASQIRVHNTRLSAERAAFLARHWGMESDGRIKLRADPALQRMGSSLYRLEEQMAIWRRIKAPLLWIEAAESENRKRHTLSPDEYNARRACFQTATVKEIQNAGHMVHLEQPEELARLIEAFLSVG
jgi:pimeloyl-ACP methyl ester carboxylesterase